MAPHARRSSAGQRGARRCADDGGPRSRGRGTRRTRVLRRRRREDRRGRAASLRRAPARVPRRRGHRCAALDRLRRAERGRRNEGPLRASRRPAPRRHGHREGDDARRRVGRDALLGEGARHRRRRVRIARARGRREGRRRSSRRARPRRHAAHAEAHAQPRRLPVDRRRRPGGRRGHRRRVAPARLHAGQGHLRSQTPGPDRGPGRLRALRRARHRRDRPAGANARLDAAAADAQRPPADLGGRRRHQLRDAGAGSALACLRRRAARRRHRRAVRARRREAHAAQRSGARSGARPAARLRRDEAARPGRHHGRRAFGDRQRDDVGLSRRRVLESDGDPGALAPPGLRQRRGLSLRARRRFRQRGARRRARVAAHRRDLRRPCRPARGRRWRAAAPRPGPGATPARDAPPRRRDSRRRHCTDLHASRIRLHPCRRRFRRDAAAVSLRPRDRGGFRRGGRAPLRLREHSHVAFGARAGDARRTPSPPPPCRRSRTGSSPATGRK